MGRIRKRADSDSSSEEQISQSTSSSDGSRKTPRKSQPASRLSQMPNELNTDDKKKLVSDAIMFILANEQKRPIFKRADVMKAIGLTGRSKDLQEEIWKNSVKKLHLVFGFAVTEIQDRKGCYLLYNELVESPEYHHLNFAQNEKAHHGLLFAILALIYMNNGIVKQEQLFNFLQRFKVYEEDMGKRDRTGNAGESEVSPEIFQVFGDVKHLIDKEWGAKQHYLAVSKVEDADLDNPQFEYKWGDRAKIEIKKSDILKFVASVYGIKPSAFRDQFDEIVQEEGENIFDDEERAQANEDLTE